MNLAFGSAKVAIAEEGGRVDIGAYLDEVCKAYDSGHATEHSYRKPLQGLFESIDSSLTIINEAKQSEGGMPDFLFLRGEITFGWAEAKNVDKDVIRLKGYSVDQWLKDRRGRTLSWEDITHYQRVVKILAETDRIMREIELPLN